MKGISKIVHFTAAKARCVVSHHCCSLQDFKMYEPAGQQKETLENFLRPSPGFLKSLAMTGESESYVDPL